MLPRWLGDRARPMCGDARDVSGDAQAKIDTRTDENSLSQTLEAAVPTTWTIANAAPSWSPVRHSIFVPGVAAPRTCAGQRVYSPKSASRGNSRAHAVRRGSALEVPAHVFGPGRGGGDSPRG